MRTAFITLTAVLTTLFSCESEEDEANDVIATSIPEMSAATSASDSKGNVYEVGFNQVSSTNQDPYVTKKDDQGNVVWTVQHESSPVDSRAILVNIDEGDIPYIVFSVDGGSNSDEYITKKMIQDGAFSNVFQNSYGSGGGPKASVIARLDPDNGTIEKGSFITARLSNGSTNSLTVTKLGFIDNQPVFEVRSAAWPPGPGTSYSRFPDITDEDRIDGAFRIWYEMSADFSEIITGTLISE